MAKLGFRISAPTATEYEAKGGKWEPQLHFTGQLTQKETKAVQAIIDRHKDGLVAYHYCTTFGGKMYSLELQWASDEAAKKNMMACRREYMKLS